MSIRFDGKVALVTGAGNGLGRAYALLLASRGAKVIVNDLGGGFKGDGQSTKAADTVVEEIKQMGGTAVANYESCVNGKAIIDQAVKEFGKIDIIVNNAGILRDVSFAKMTEKDWDLINEIHLKSVYNISKAAWPIFREQKYGRIVNVTSAAGLYGNVGQANYSAAKMAIVGLSKTLAKEGAKKNILCNVIAPLAGSRMTATVLPEDLLNALKPELVAPLVAFLCSDQEEANGQIFEVGAGWVSEVRWERSPGGFMEYGKADPEEIKRIWGDITNFEGSDNPTSPQDSFGPVFTNLERYKEAQSKL